MIAVLNLFALLLVFASASGAGLFIYTLFLWREQLCTVCDRSGV